MEIQITEKKENALLNRTEVHFVGVHTSEAPPTQSQVRDEIAKLTSTKKEQVIVDWMRSEFGIAQLKGYAKVYKSLSSAKKYERDHILDRNKKRDGKVPQVKEAKKPAPKQDAPVEGEGGEASAEDEKAPEGEGKEAPAEEAPAEDESKDDSSDNEAPAEEKPSEEKAEDKKKE